jgi:hypothetical protein
LVGLAQRRRYPNNAKPKSRNLRSDTKSIRVAFFLHRFGDASSKGKPATDTNEIKKKTESGARSFTRRFQAKARRRVPGRPQCAHDASTDRKGPVETEPFNAAPAFSD